jgi:hypothetical protein
MKKLILIPLVALAACTPLRQVTVETDEAIVGQVNEARDFGRVVCFEGPVCKDLEVRRVQVDRDEGPVAVVLRNRTGEMLAVQVSLEVVERDGARAETTRFTDVAMAPRQERALEMPAIGRALTKDRELHVVIRARRAL